MLRTLVLIFWTSSLCLVKTQDSIEDLLQFIASTPSTATTNLTPIRFSDNGTTDTSTCNCVHFFQCNNGTLNTDGTNIIDIRGEGPCANYMDVCCENPLQNNTMDLAPTPIPVSPVIPVQPVQPVVPSKGCGYRNENGIGFKIKGAVNGEAQFGEFPWMIAVQRLEPVGNKLKQVYTCGGSLIHPQVVLTAAHCVDKKDQKFIVRAGEWDTQTTSEIYPFQSVLVESVMIHENYYSGALFNDVALLFLKKPFNLTSNVQVSCLPQQDDIIVHSECFATGWGKDNFGKEGKYQVILKKVALPIMERKQCQNALRTTRLGKYFELHRSFVCAGGQPGVDTCKGDGGGPLVCPVPGNPGQYQQVGITSWGIGCGAVGIPGVYVNVASFRNWIDEQMQYARLETVQYAY